MMNFIQDCKTTGFYAIDEYHTTSLTALEEELMPELACA